MTVKQLIIRLLEENMDSQVKLSTDDKLFDIDSVEHWDEELILLNFTDWRVKE